MGEWTVEELVLLVAELHDEIDQLRTKLQAAEVERDAALWQMRELSGVIDKYEAGDDLS